MSSIEKTVQIIRSQSHDPYFNLALEDLLMRQMAAGISVQPSFSQQSNDAEHETQDKPVPQAILYLWQNQNTVVIGRNQNAWAECKTALLEEEGGKLARRTTGGGAVFHDLGNLNFSLLLPQRDFDLERNFQMIVDTVRHEGIPAERSGRNDILVDGMKFSGNAFRLDHGIGLHHGTLLVSSAFERVGRYLTVAPAKLAAKGIASVRSRVTNLCAYRPDLSIAQLMDSLEAAFIAQFGEGAHLLRKSSDDYRDNPALTDLTARFASWDWRYGETLQFDAELSGYFTWGHCQLGFHVENGHVSAVRFFSDALDCDWVAHVEHTLLSLPFSSERLAAALRDHKEMPGGFGISRAQMADDLATLVLEQGW